jgi:M6 family metalloprotease-like protein
MQLVEQEDGTYAKADMQQMTRRANVRRANIASRHRAPRRVVVGEQTHYVGQKKGIVILMQFQDTKFKTANNLAKYNNILNKENYTTSPFKGSVADYFKAQSGGIFELDFDVLGPYTAAKNASYYGSNNSDGDDLHPDELVVEAVKAANSEVNFKDYDWDNDGEVDQVFILYAGKGEADGGAANTIWPHMYYLSATSKSLTLDGVRIDTYACSNEIIPDGTIEGIGCFCHEFSHCMGFPDFYDTSYSGWYGTGSYDLMCSGSYNGDSYQPAGYTAYEKWMAGWLEPIVLDKEGVTVDSMKPLSNGGEAYIIYNDGNPKEYYMLENRQKTGWDASLPGKGLMITHVDFDSTIWQENNPNTKVTSQDVQTYAMYGITLHVNDHQRYAIVCADNSASDYSPDKDLYPNSGKNSLTDTSTPKASLYNKNTDGTKLLHKPITQIKQNSDKTMSFLFRGGYQEPDTTQIVPVDTTTVVPVDTTIVVPGDTIPVIVVKGDTLFYESFNKCDKKGGNDGNWSGNIGSSTIQPDNEGWEYLAGYAGDQCARFGNAGTLGTTTTPEFPIDGEAILTFKAAAWTGDGVALKVEASNGVTASVSQMNMPTGEWGEFTITLTGEGMTQLTFSPQKRFFLDEVLVMKPKSEEPPIEEDLTGDLNNDGKVDAADIVTLINIIAKKTKENAEQ